MVMLVSDDLQLVDPLSPRRTLKILPICLLLLAGALAAPFRASMGLGRSGALLPALPPRGGASRGCPAGCRAGARDALRS